MIHRKRKPSSMTSSSYLANNRLAIFPLRDHPELLSFAASWFSEKWEIPMEAYQESIQACIEKKKTIPQWYVVVNEQKELIAGAGVIDNDFHHRKDLQPNLCALYVEENYRNHQLASYLLNYIQKDFANIGIYPLYLITDLTNFYEKYGWEFLTMVTEENGGQIKLYQSPKTGPVTK